MKDNKEILKHFDRMFNTETAKHIKFDNMKLLKVLYEYFEEDIYTRTKGTFWKILGSWKFNDSRGKWTAISVWICDSKGTW